MAWEVREEFHHRRTLTALSAAGTTLLFPLQPSQADVAITAQQAANTAQNPPSPQTFRLFYKGSNARLEVAGGPVILYDGKDGIIHTLDTAHKTYYTTLVTQVQDAGDPLPPGAAGRVTKDVKLDLHRTDQTQTIAGLTAHQYTVSGSVTFTHPGGFGGHRGHHRGGSGFPGGGGFPGGFPLVGSAPVDQYGGDGGYGGRGGAPALPQWSISGEVWLADTVTFPDKADALSATQLAAASAGPFLQPLNDALGKQKGLLLLARITVTETPPSSTGQSDGDAGDGASSGGGIPTDTATTLTVQTVSTSPLSDTLFQTPLDYTLVPAPQAPYVPGAIPPPPSP